MTFSLLFSKSILNNLDYDRLNKNYSNSPATEALELLNDDPNVMFDLNEMLKRDPTLSSLVKEEPGTGSGPFATNPQSQFGVQASDLVGNQGDPC